ncbi:hypothetical protein Bca101_020466 [Brassica carinata]
MRRVRDGEAPAGFAEENENVAGGTRVSTASPVHVLVSNPQNLQKDTEFNEIRCVLDVFLSPSCDSEASSQSPVPGFVFLLEEKISVASDLHLVAVARVRSQLTSKR